jgi:hypothetical protein
MILIQNNNKYYDINNNNVPRDGNKSLWNISINLLHADPNLVLILRLPKSKADQNTRSSSWRNF